MAIKAKASFQAQAISRPKTDGLHMGGGQQGADKGFSLVGRYQDLKAVLARVARAGHDDFAIRALNGRKFHKAQTLWPVANIANGIHSFGPLDCNQGAIIGPRQRRLARTSSSNNGKVLFFAASIDDEIKRALIGICFRATHKQII